jgi:quinol monooxygenase YgiN
MEDNMLARVTRVKIQPDHVNDAIEKTDSQIIPDIRDDSGLSAFYVLGDRSTGDALVITLWETDEAEQESRSKVAQRFGILGDYLAGQPEPSEKFEVLNSFVPSRAPTA